MAKLSIITINYNDSAGLEATIKSVISQTDFQFIEYIVIDDGSSDGSIDVIRQYADRLAFWTTRPNKGIYATMNEGVRNATGDYCLFLSSGDIFHSNTVIEEILATLDGTDLIIGRMVFLADGHLSDVETPITFKTLYKNTVPHGSTIIRRELMIRHPYDETLRIVSDWKFFVQTIIFDNVSYKKIETIILDFDCNGISSRNRDLCQFEREKVYKELFPPRVIQDYFQFVKGGGYQDTIYDKFYVKLRDYKYAKVIYTLSVLLMRFVAIFKKGARFVKHFPIKY